MIEISTPFHPTRELRRFFDLFFTSNINCTISSNSGSSNNITFLLNWTTKSVRRRKSSVRRHLLESMTFLSAFTTELRPSNRKCFSTLMTMFRGPGLGRWSLSTRHWRRSRTSLFAEKIISHGFHCALNDVLRRCSFEGRWCSSRGFVSRHHCSGRNSIFIGEREENEITRETISKVLN